MSAKQAEALLKAGLINIKGQSGSVTFKSASGKKVQAILVLRGLGNEPPTEAMLELKERFYAIATDIKNKEINKNETNR